MWISDCVVFVRFAGAVNFVSMWKRKVDRSPISSLFFPRVVVTWILQLNGDFFEPIRYSIGCLWYVAILYNIFNLLWYFGITIFLGYCVVIFSDFWYSLSALRFGYNNNLRNCKKCGVIYAIFRLCITIEVFGMQSVISAIAIQYLVFNWLLWIWDRFAMFNRELRVWFDFHQATGFYVRRFKILEKNSRRQTRAEFSVRSFKISNIRF